jgi:hypothetical protein
MTENRSGWRKVKSKWCKVCGIQSASEVHHIKARVDGGSNTEENLIDLCSFCHKYAPNDEEFEKYKNHHGILGLYFAKGIQATLYDYGLELGLPEKLFKRLYKDLIKNETR